MKVVVMVCLLFAVALAAPEKKSRGCIYALGRCIRECEEGTHGYYGGCSTITLSQKTCEEPEQRELGRICDYSRCDCDEPTVLDTTTGKCVKLEDCPKPK